MLKSQKSKQWKRTNSITLSRETKKEHTRVAGSLRQTVNCHRSRILIGVVIIWAQNWTILFLPSSLKAQCKLTFLHWQWQNFSRWSKLLATIFNGKEFSVEACSVTDYSSVLGFTCITVHPFIIQHFLKLLPWLVYNITVTTSLLAVMLILVSLLFLITIRVHEW